MSSRYLVLDAPYLCHRARYTTGTLSYHGHPTGVAYGVLQSILTLSERFNPTHICFCFDSIASKRQALYPQYKANRIRSTPEETAFRQQVRELRLNLLPEIGFRNIFGQHGYEADDLMAAVALHKGQRREDSITLVTADEDLFQCIQTNISVYNPRTKIRMTLQKFWETYRIHPEDWILIKAIAGGHDNIPGLKGIGEKTAIQYVRGKLKHGSKAENAIVGAQEIGGPLDTYIRLVELPFDCCRTPKWEPDEVTPEAWGCVCLKLGFHSLVQQYPGAPYAHR